MGSIGTIVAVIAIVAMIAFLVYKLKGNSHITTTPTKTITFNSNSEGARKDVVIKNCGPNKLEAVKYVKEATGCGLKEAKDVVENNGTIEALPVEIAQTLVANLNRIGASAEIK